MLKLRVMHDGVEVQNIDLKEIGKPVFTIGRADSCDIRINDHAVGREHAVISLRDHVLYLKKKSKFGLMSLNGEPTNEAEVHPGDIISIANYRMELKEEATQLSAAVQTLSEPSKPLYDADAFIANATETPSVEIKSETITPEVGTGIHIEKTDDDLFATPPQSQTQSNTENKQNADDGIKLEMTNDVAQAATDNSVKSDSPSIELNLGGIGAQSSSANAVAAIALPDDKTAPIAKSKVAARLIFKPGDANHMEYILEKDEVSIGRSEECDIVLNDRLSSRKNSIIRKVGMSFVIQDLGSGNGTIVNGSRVSNHELSSDDVIKIGDVEFSFQATNTDYQEKQAEFLKTKEPTRATLSIQSPHTRQTNGLGMGGALPSSNEMNPFNVPPISYTGIPGVQTEPQKPATLVDRFKKLTTIQKILVGGVLVLILLLGTQEDKGTAGKGAKNGVIKTENEEFKNLTKDKKQFVVNTYKLANDLIKGAEYEKAIIELNKLHEVLPGGYKDSKDLLEMAKQQLEIERSRAEEKRRKEEQDKIRKEVAELVAKANELYGQSKFDDVRLILTQIFERDPENPDALRLKQQMDEKLELEKRKQQEEENNKLTRQKLLDLLAQGRALLKRQKYFDVMDLMDQAPSTGSTDSKLLAQAKALKQAAIKGLANKVRPFLDKGYKALESGDYLTARDSFMKVLRFDPFNLRAKSGLAKVRDELEKRSKVIYADAVIREYASDLEGARAKYEECLRQSMPYDKYYLRCQSKLKRYDILPKAGSSAGEEDRATASSHDSESHDGADPQMPAFSKPNETGPSER